MIGDAHLEGVVSARALASKEGSGTRAHDAMWKDPE